MMCGWEQRLLRASLVDAVVNLALSVVLVRQLGVVGVAIGTLVPTVLVGWLWIVPLTADFVGVSVWRLLGELYLPAWKPVAAGGLVLLLVAGLAPAGPGAQFPALVCRGLFVGVATIAAAWPLWRAVRAQRP